jgi:hypothetical protein
MCHSRYRIQHEDAPSPGRNNLQTTLMAGRQETELCTQIYTYLPQENLKVDSSDIGSIYKDGSITLLVGGGGNWVCGNCFISYVNSDFSLFLKRLLPLILHRVWKNKGCQYSLLI